MHQLLSPTTRRVLKSDHRILAISLFFSHFRALFTILPLFVESNLPPYRGNKRSTTPKQTRAQQAKDATPTQPAFVTRCFVRIPAAKSWNPTSSSPREGKIAVSVSRPFPRFRAKKYHHGPSRAALLRSIRARG